MAAHTNGMDWTKLLADPELSQNLEQLLRVYRTASPENRNAALLDIIKRIKSGADGRPAKPLSVMVPAPVPTNGPPIDLEAVPERGEDRRLAPRFSCHVAVELRLSNSPSPIWGNLANTSRGGCMVETIHPIAAKTDLDIGLWISSGTLWVKGLALSGTVSGRNPGFGIHVKFNRLTDAERDALRQFLSVVESSNRGFKKENDYLTQLRTSK